MAQNKLTVGELVYRISGDMENLKSELKEAKRRVGDLENEMDRTQKTTNTLSGRFKQLKTTVIAAAAVIGYQLARAFRFAVNAASDLVESTNAVNVVFGEASKTVLEFGRNAAHAVGLSTAEFNQLSAQTGALLKDTGLSLEEVANETIKLTVRAADLASVYNTDVKDALSAINQAIRGETEAIRRYTGDVTDATLEQYALANGIESTVAEMSQQEKRLLRVRVLMDQTNDVAGDFDKTSANLANRMRVLRAQSTNVAAQLGTSLLPALELLAGQALENAENIDLTTQKINNMGKTFYGVAQGIIATVKILQNGIRGVTLIMESFVAFSVGAAKSILEVASAVKRLFGGDAGVIESRIDSLNLVMAELRENSAETRKKIADDGKEISEALGQVFNPTNYEGVSQDQVVETLAGVTEGMDGLGKGATSTGEKVEDFSDKLIGLAQSARKAKEEVSAELSDKINEFGDDIRANVQDTVASLAQIVVGAEEKIAELEDEAKQARKDGNQDRVREIRDQVKEQEQILAEREGFEERQAERIKAIRESLVEAGIDVEQAGLDSLMNVRTLEEQIEEERRMASLSEFQRFEEQQAKELALLTDKFITEARLLQEKVERQKNFEAELSSFLSKEQDKRLANTEEWAQKTIDKYGEVAQSLKGLLSTERQIGNFVSEVPRSPSSVVQTAATNTRPQQSNTTNNTTNVQAPVTINGQGIENLGIETISAIMGFEIEKRVRK